MHKAITMGEIQTAHTSTNENPADLLTKVVACAANEIIWSANCCMTLLIMIKMCPSYGFGGFGGSPVISMAKYDTQHCFLHVISPSGLHQPRCNLRRLNKASQTK